MVFIGTTREARCCVLVHKPVRARLSPAKATVERKSWARRGGKKDPKFLHSFGRN